MTLQVIMLSIPARPAGQAGIEVESPTHLAWAWNLSADRQVARWRLAIPQISNRNYN